MAAAGLKIKVRVSNKLRYTLGGFGRPFYFLWCGETISLLGIALMEFALGVWVYQKTGSVLDFSGVIAASIIPTLLALPFAGRVADRFNRRYVMITADVITAILILVLASLLWKRSLEVEHLYIFNILASLAGSFRGAAYIVSVSQLILKEKYTQASGLIGMSSNLVSMFAPMVAGWLIATIGLPGIVYIDLITFCIGSIFILKAFFYFGKAKEYRNTNDSSPDKGSISVTREFLKQEPLMLGLFFYLILLHGSLSLVSIMMMPMVLSHYSAQDLGVVLAFGAAGGLLGAMLLTFINSPKQLMVTVLIGDAILSLCVILIGITTHLTLYCMCTFIAVFVASFTKGCSHSLWMRKVPLQYRGRVFSIIGATMLTTTLFVLLLGG